MSAWRPGVRSELERHGLAPAPGETAEALHARLNQRYLEEIRALRQRQRAGEIPLADYARQAAALRARYELLGLPLELWRV